MKKIIGSVIIVIVFLLIIGLIMFFSGSKEASIRNEIEQANYCEVDADCVDAGGKCPFGCYVFVNENEVDKISALLDSYETACVYGCVSLIDVACENNKCVEIFD